mmetsp:Transcript_16900/g.27940  ORF Transcript_16900/g.27940 Transcript_16900/m.27940 type:complete len:704 (+) Transcript_16900:207-2318(+)
MTAIRANPEEEILLVEKPPALIKLKCHYGGSFVESGSKARRCYDGGEIRLITIPSSISYSELMFRLAEEYGGVTLKYELGDNSGELVTVRSQEDFEELCSEYADLRALNKRYLDVYLFDALEEGIYMEWPDTPGMSLGSSVGFSDWNAESDLNPYFDFGFLPSKSGTCLVDLRGGEYATPSTFVGLSTPTSTPRVFDRSFHQHQAEYDSVTPPDFHHDSDNEEENDDTGEIFVYRPLEKRTHRGKDVPTVHVSPNSDLYLDLDPTVGQNVSCLGAVPISNNSTHLEVLVYDCDIHAASHGSACPELQGLKAVAEGIAEDVLGESLVVLDNNNHIDEGFGSPHQVPTLRKTPRDDVNIHDTTLRKTPRDNVNINDTTNVNANAFRSPKESPNDGFTPVMVARKTTPIDVLPRSGSALRKTPDQSRAMAWEIQFTELQLGNVLGQGGFGKVFRGSWRGTEVAVKTLHQGFAPNLQHAEFQSEVELLSSLRHPNIILFMGACPPPHLSIVTELCWGSLYTVLRTPSIPLQWGRVLKLATDVAKGMSYLHGFSTPVVHLDLKSQNVLIDENMNAKITDFGLSRFKMNQYISGSHGLRGTYGWMAPEIIEKKPFTEKADCWSYGVLLLELCTRRDPYFGKDPPQIVYDIMVARKGPDIPPGCPKLYADLIADCRNYDPELRPSFDQILSRLRTVFDSLTPLQLMTHVT